MNGSELDDSQQAGAGGADVCGECTSDNAAADRERLDSTYTPMPARLQPSVTPIQCAIGTTAEAETDEDHARFPGFGVAPGTLELVQLHRPDPVNKVSLPLPLSTSGCYPILQEYYRPWRALHLGTELGAKPREELPQDQCLLKNYEPHLLERSPTFPSIDEIPMYLKPRAAVDEAAAFVIIPRIRFDLGTVEPLFCHVMVYDTSLCCRATEEYHFTLAGPPLPSGDSSSIDCTWTQVSEVSHAALLHILPNHQPQHLYVVLKVTKILSGDGNSATAPYCIPDKMSTQTEQQKLIDRAVDCSQRLGRYRQPLAWGAISLAEGMNRPMTLYRQRAAMSDELRIPLIADAMRGTLKEKIVPAMCEFDLKRVDQDQVLKCKFQPQAQVSACTASSEDQHSEYPTALSIVDPFTTSIESIFDGGPTQSPGTIVDDPDVIPCRELQPFCHSSMTSVFGLTGSGPVATSFVNVLYLYPVRLEKFQHRNVTVQVQLLEQEIDAITSVNETELRPEVLRAIYSSGGGGIARSAYTLVSYHQKSPQFEDEFKICLPERLSRTHHVLFTFYHVHCKKLQASQQQQELIGYAVLPLLREDGTVIDDTSYSVAVFSARTPAKQAKLAQGMLLPPNYVQAAREASADNVCKGTNFMCRTRVLSSVYSQDKTIAELLEPFHTAVMSPLESRTAGASDAIVSMLERLRQANSVHLRYFLLSTMRFVLGYLRTGPSSVKKAAFHALLIVFDKVSCSTHRSLKPQLQETNKILHHYIQFVYDEDLVDSKYPNIEEASKREPLYRAVMKEWLNVLHSNDSSDESMEMKRVSITFSSVLLQLVTKSIAMTLMSSKRKSVDAASEIPAAAVLPQRLLREDDILVERLTDELILCAGNSSLGLLLQKEVNRSLAWFCRSLFLVVLNSAPGRVICRHIKSMENDSNDPNTLVHLQFPFLQILIDFEFFATVNRATTLKLQPELPVTKANPLKSTGELAFKRAWLAHVIFRSLLRVVDEQKELKISLGAARLIRHLFVVHVQNPRHQTKEEQKAIALAYSPFLKELAEFTTELKLFGGGETMISEEIRTDTTASNHFQLKKELLICVAHLLSVVSRTNLPKLYIDEPEAMGTLDSAREASMKWRQTTALNPTSALMHYRKVVHESTASNGAQARGIVFPSTKGIGAATLSVSLEVGSDDSRASRPFDEERIHACFALIRHVVDVFMVDVTAIQADPSPSPSSSPWKWFLSPSLTTSEVLSPLQELEYQVRHRGSHYRMIAVLEEKNSAIRRANPLDSNASQTQSVPSQLSDSNSMSSMSITNVGPRTPMQRTMPRAWGKNYIASQHKRSTSEGSPPETKFNSESSLVQKSEVESTRNVASMSLKNRNEERWGHNLHHIIASAVLRSLQGTVDLFEQLIRVIEIPFDHQRGREMSRRNASVSRDQAYVLLGSITELFFFLLRRVSKIDTLNGTEGGSSTERHDGDFHWDNEPRSSCIVVDLLSYLESFLQRFQISFFACRIPGLPLIHDEYCVHQIMTIACLTKSASVRHHAAMLLCTLIATCYDQTGSFQLVKGTILKVMTAVFFPDGYRETRVELLQAALSTDEQREVVEEMRQCFGGSERGSRSFQIQVIDLLNGLTTMIKVYEMWRVAISGAIAIHDFEEIEDGLFRVFQSLSSRWLFEQKQQWLHALLQLHLLRGNFAEAAVCTLRSIQISRDAASTSNNSDSCNDEWIIRELISARVLAERANWPHKEMEVCEELLQIFKKRRLYADYRSTLRHLDGVITKVSGAFASDPFIDGEHKNDHAHMSTGFAFYRVKFAGDSVSAHVARNEYIYKRSTFTSLGDFVNEMKAMVRTKYPACERVDVVPESKPLPLSDDQPNVIFMRVSSVEHARDASSHGLSEAAGGVFKFATPFTLSSSKAYGKTSEQLKRVTYMSVAHEFPCMLSRQVVQRRVVVVRCPIETAMDDIRKRCALLRTEIRKEMHGSTDVKTLTLVLKGSVDTHVHGGIPEVIESFLAAAVVANNASDSASAGDCGSNVGNGCEGVLPTLLTATGVAMDADTSLRRRHELANVLVEFAVLCCCCLLIGREAFRRCSTPTSNSAASMTASVQLNTTTTASSPSLSAQLVATPASALPVLTLSILASEAKTADLLSSQPPRIPCATRVSSSACSTEEIKSMDELLALLLPDASANASSAVSDTSASPSSESPLQRELERSFAELVQLMHSQVRIPFETAAVLPALLRRLEHLRMKEPSEPATLPTDTLA